MAQGTAPLASCGKPGLCLLEYLDHSQRPLALHSEVVLFVFLANPASGSLMAMYIWDKSLPRVISQGPAPI